MTYTCVRVVPDCIMGAMVRNDKGSLLITNEENQTTIEGMGENLVNGVYFAMVQKDGKCHVFDYVTNGEMKSKKARTYKERFDEINIDDAALTKVETFEINNIDELKTQLDDSECGLLVIKNDTVHINDYIHIMGFSSEKIL